MLITRRNLSDEVQERILELIADGSIAMGSKIDFNSLQEMFGVSRASVREGVQRLMGKGVLESAGPQDGYRVVSLTPDDIRALFDVRRTLETHALRGYSHNISSDKLRELRHRFTSELTQSQISEGSRPSREYRSADWELHFELIVGCSNSRALQSISSNILELVSLVRSLIETLAETSFQHIEIIDALLEKDTGCAIDLLQQHLVAVEQRAIDALEQSIRRESETK